MKRQQDFLRLAIVLRTQLFTFQLKRVCAKTLDIIFIFGYKYWVKKFHISVLKKPATTTRMFSVFMVNQFYNSNCQREYKHERLVGNQRQYVRKYNLFEGDKNVK